MSFIARPSESLAELFTHPPKAFSPVPIWWWSGDPLDADRLRWQLDRLIEGGVHQAVIMNLAPSGPLYGALADMPAFFSDAWWSLFTGVCRDATERGFSLWFYDQLGFSGADIQGQIAARTPTYRGQTLHRVSSVDRATGLPRLPPGATPLGVHAYSLDGGFDYLAPDACAALLNAVHGEFERHVGDYLGTTIVGSFQDELPSMPTWSRDFAAQFEARRGYDVLPHLAALWEDVGETTAGIRADYQRTRAELAEEAFFRPLHAWHEQRGLAVGCDQQHPARAGYPLEATQQYADYLRTHRWYSAPGSDHWGEAKVHSSLAHLYDRPRTWVEAFHTTGWGSTLEETFDWLLPWLRAGATLYNPHAFYYSTRGSRWEWAPPSTCWRQPYWLHYPLFAQTVTRLCAALSWGDHVCDIGVLFPTATVQAELGLDLPEFLFGVPPGTSKAQETYLDIVGRMHWFEPMPGALDRDHRDFDVLDDDSLTRASLVGDTLVVSGESYRAVILPACRVLESATARALARFVEAGGTVVAVGDAPAAESGATSDGRAIARVRELLAAGSIRHVADAGQLGAALADLPRRVAAPVPTLMRTDGDSTLVFVVGAYPGATVQPPGRSWRENGYDFDSDRYVRTMRITVTDVIEPAAVWDPGTGVMRLLTVHADSRGGLTVDVPLADSPCALVVFGPAALTGSPIPDAGLHMSSAALDPALQPADVDPARWTASLIPTLDNRWADFAVPAAEGPLPVRIWDLEHRVDDSAEWQPVRATYGPWGEQQRAGENSWRPLIYSDSAGLPPEVGATEPHGIVAEEFIDLGPAIDGEMGRVRVTVRCAAAARGHLTIGSTAAKDVRWNGRPVLLTGGPYYGLAQVDARAGDNFLEIDVIAGTARRLRASWTLRSAPEPMPRPQWLCADPATSETASTTLTRRLTLPDAVDAAVLQLGTIGRASLTVNGAVVARHGEFDNYAHVRQPRVRRYDVREQLVIGDNTVSVELHEKHAAAVIDAFLEVDGDELCFVTDDRWSGEAAGESVAVRGPAEVPHDPRWVQLRPRPHSLPRGHLLDRSPDDDTFLGTPIAPGHVGHVEWFRFQLPPGATALHLPVHGHVEVEVPGHSVTYAGETCELDSPAAAGLACVIRVTPTAPHSGGALWRGPVEIDCDGTAAMALGNWAGLGLVDYSGGVHYRTVVEGGVDGVVLDLGAVRGTAEVRVNGHSAGVRIWSPYRFDIDGLCAGGRTEIEVEVYNTLAPHMAAVSPTPWVLPGQRVSGLLGPVVIWTRPH